MKSEDYVLQNFSQDEKTVLKETLSRTLEAFLYYCDVNADLNKVQNKYN